MRDYIGKYVKLVIFVVFLRFHHMGVGRDWTGQKPSTNRTFSIKISGYRGGHPAFL